MALEMRRHIDANFWDVSHYFALNGERSKVVTEVNSIAKPPKAPI
jgi:hypothetical protein